MIVRLSIGGKIVTVADCTAWGLIDDAPVCQRGLPLDCETCSARTARPPSAQRQEPRPLRPQSLPSKAASWAKAELSALVRTITPETIAARLDACRACDRLDPAPQDSGKVGWCRACGCGRNSRSELLTKTTLPAATCPLGRWPAP